MEWMGHGHLNPSMKLEIIILATKKKLHYSLLLTIPQYGSMSPVLDHGTHIQPPKKCKCSFLHCANPIYLKKFPAPPGGGRFLFVQELTFFEALCHVFAAGATMLCAHLVAETQSWSCARVALHSLRCHSPRPPPCAMNATEQECQICTCCCCPSRRAALWDGSGSNVQCSAANLPLPTHQTLL